MPTKSVKSSTRNESDFTRPRGRSRPSRWIAAHALVSYVLCCSLSAARADSVSDLTQQRKRSQSWDQSAKTGKQKRRAAIKAATPAKSEDIKRQTQQAVNPFAKFENLREKGLAISIPGPADTITQDRGGVRSALADMGIGYVGWTQNNFATNLLPNAARTSIANQQYIGQNPTAWTVNHILVTYDLSRFGIPDGQFIVEGEQQWCTWNPCGPNRYGIGELAYYQTFLDRKLELKIGYLKNSWEFAGAVVGGNIASNVFGPSSSIIYQGGVGSSTNPTPSVNLKYNFDDHLYSKASFQRSISPDGVLTETAENPAALNWTVPNAGFLFLNETGYRNNAAPGLLQTWLRAGAGYNTSRYTSLALPNQQRTDPNAFYYIAADKQFWQPNVQDSASHGVYGGFSVMGAPSDLNKVTQYYELRLYAIGLFDWRPTDQVSFVATDTVWSNLAVDTALAQGKLVHWDTKAISLTYTAHLAQGIYTSLGLSYINNPTSITYTPQTGHALNFSLSTSVYF